MPRLIATPAVAEPVTPVPRAMITPASAGPTTRAALKAIELSAMALARRLRGTRSGASAWRSGMSMAFTQPEHECHGHAPSGSRRRRWRSAGTGRTPGRQAAICVPIRARRLSMRSASTPPNGREDHGRAELEHGHEAELDRRAAERQHEPRQADLLHPGADQAHDLAGPVEAVVPDAEGREAALQPAERGAQRQRARLVGSCAGDGDRPRLSSPGGCSC